MGTSQEAPATITGPPPYDNPTADLILRSSDNVDFHVHSAFLTRASRVFADMIDVAGHCHTEVGSTSVVDLQDKGDDIKLLLNWTDPCVVIPVVLSLEEIARVIILCDKYDMPGVCSRVSMLCIAHLDRDPVGVYCVAYQHRKTWGADILRSAAGKTLSLGPTWAVTNTAVMSLIPGVALMRLFQYRAACVHRIQVLLESYEFNLIPSYSDDGNNCMCIWSLESGGSGYINSGWHNYAKHLAIAMQASPSPHVITHFSLQHQQVLGATPSDYVCPVPNHGNALDYRLIRKFNSQFAKDMEKEIKKVELVID